MHRRRDKKYVDSAPCPICKKASDETGRISYYHLIKYKCRCGHDFVLRKHDGVSRRFDLEREVEYEDGARRR